jgi:BMFP domain-containing protein YqiC
VNSKTPTTKQEIESLKEQLLKATELLLRTIEHYHLLEKRLEDLEARVKVLDDPVH